MPLHLLLQVHIGSVIFGFLELQELLPLRRSDFHYSILTEIVIDTRSINLPAAEIRLRRREDAEFLLAAYGRIRAHQN